MNDITKTKNPIWRPGDDWRILTDDVRDASEVSVLTRNGTVRLLDLPNRRQSRLPSGHQHGGGHSRTERLFMDAIWAMARSHLEGGGISPLTHSTTSAFFEQLSASTKPDDADALSPSWSAPCGRGRRAVPCQGPA